MKHIINTYHQDLWWILQTPTGLAWGCWKRWLIPWTQLPPATSQPGVRRAIMFYDECGDGKALGNFNHRRFLIDIVLPPHHYFIYLQPYPQDTIFIPPIDPTWLSDSPTPAPKGLSAATGIAPTCVQSSLNSSEKYSICDPSTRPVFLPKETVTSSGFINPRLFNRNVYLCRYKMI